MGAGVIMLCQHASAVLDGHVIPGEGDHLGAQGAMETVQRDGVQRVRVFRLDIKDWVWNKV
jgi:hypothetical protein